MKKPSFVTGGMYHIYNRGVEKRNVFLDKEDHFRFIHDLFEFNDEELASNIYYKKLALQSYEVEPRKIGIGKKLGGSRADRRNMLVEIIAYCLMPNHFHLFVRQIRDGGVVSFMQKIGTGYTMYFNKKYDRVGALFQGRYKAVALDTDRHFLYLPHYIHLNPLDIKYPHWRNAGQKERQKALSFLETYRWSSYMDHSGKKNFPSLISKNQFRRFYGSPSDYKRSLVEWVTNADEDTIKDIVIDG